MVHNGGLGTFSGCASSPPIWTWPVLQARARAECRCTGATEVESFASMSTSPPLPEGVPRGAHEAEHGNSTRGRVSARRGLGTAAREARPRATASDTGNHGWKPRWP